MNKHAIKKEITPCLPLSALFHLLLTIPFTSCSHRKGGRHGLRSQPLQLSGKICFKYYNNIYGNCKQCLASRHENLSIAMILQRKLYTLLVVVREKYVRLSKPTQELKPISDVMFGGIVLMSLKIDRLKIFR